MMVVVLTLFASSGLLVVDLGSWYGARRDAQAAADCSALAGAIELPSFEDDAGAVVKAQSAAASWAVANDVDPADLTVEVFDDCYGANDEVHTGVRVTVPREPGCFFIGLFPGIPTPSVSAVAVACSGTPQSHIGFMPWVVQLSGSCFQDDPSDPTRRIPIYGARCDIVVAAGTSSVGQLGCDDPGGCADGNSSANAYEANIVAGVDRLCSIGDSVSSNPGVNVRKTPSGLETRLAAEGDGRRSDDDDDDDDDDDRNGRRSDDDGYTKRGMDYSSNGGSQTHRSSGTTGTGNYSPPTVQTLTVTKIVINNDGGTAVVADVTLRIDGATVASGVTNQVSAGAHFVSERGGPSGYSATIGGDCAEDGSITLAAGAHANCTISNDAGYEGETWLPPTSTPPAPASPFTVTFTKAVTTSGGAEAPATGSAFGFELDCIGTNRTFALAAGESYSVTFTGNTLCSLTETSSQGADPSAASSAGGSSRPGRRSRSRTTTTWPGRSSGSPSASC